MIGRIAAMAALIALVGCAGVESAGRNAQRSAEPRAVPVQRTVQPSTPLPPPQRQAPAPVVQSQPLPAPVPPPPQPVQRSSAPILPPPAAAPAPTQRAPVAAANVAAPPPPRPVAAREGDIVVPGTVERQVPAPNGDPRSVAERTADIRAWDRCVTRVQSSFETDPTRPQLDTPEDVCSQSLGMASRNAVPDSRSQRRR